MIPAATVWVLRSSPTSEPGGSASSPTTRQKYGGLEGFDLEIVGRFGLPTVITPHNVRYLRTKQERMGHTLDQAVTGA